jgi:hypothetical protein
MACFHRGSFLPAISGALPFQQYERDHTAATLAQETKPRCNLVKKSIVKMRLMHFHQRQPCKLNFPANPWLKIPHFASFARPR